VEKIIPVFVAAFALSAALAVQADMQAKQTAETLCAGCHGPDGISTNDLWPNLAGQKIGYMAKQLRAYRDGTRADPSMTGLTQTLSDDQIQALAEYYAKL